MKKLAIGLAILGIVVIVAAAILGWVVVPNIIEDKIEEEVRLIPETDTWEKWAEVPFDVFLTFYIYHVKNADAVENQKAKPEFEERGPYAYRQKRIRVEITQNDTADTSENRVQYSDEKTYWFDAERSNGTEDDLVNVINLPFVAVIHGVRSRLPGLEETIANKNLKGETFIRRNVKVGELLFKGMDVSKYTDDPLLSSLLPEEFDGGRFGLYKGENATAGKRFNIHTGVDDNKNFGKIITYDNKTDLEFWVPNTPCDQVQGTDGTVFPPFFTKDRKIDVFVTDLCRSLRLEYQENVKVKGIKAYRFTVPKYVLEDPRINEDNMCYCLNANKDDCPRAAAMSLEKCRNGAPIMMSTPHFLDGYEGYLNDSGLSPPEVEKHFTHLDIEPNSGVLLDAHKRIQVNIEVFKYPTVDVYQNLFKDHFLFPIVWADESGTIDEKSAEDLKGRLLKPLQLVEILKWTFIGVGVVLFLAGIAVFFIKRKSKTTV